MSKHGSFLSTNQESGKNDENATPQKSQATKQRLRALHKTAEINTSYYVPATDSTYAVLSKKWRMVQGVEDLTSKLQQWLRRWELDGRLTKNCWTFQKNQRLEAFHHC